MDVVLHRERLDESGLKNRHRLEGPVSDLPDGTMLADGDKAYLVKGGVIHSWSWEGYSPAAINTSSLVQLTPPSTVRAFRAGFVPNMK